MSTDALGDRMKAYERRETGALFLPMIPIYARMDGIGFSKLTKGFAYPYDMRFRNIMLETTRWLVERTQARIGYTQSDEISLCWLADDYGGETFFHNKKYKMMSALASAATTKFKDLLDTSGDPFLIQVSRRLPEFDSRVYQLPTKMECANTFLWRELDATKNALQMAVRAHYSYKQMVGKKAAELHEMLYKKGINFNDYPAIFKRGAYVQRRAYMKKLTEEQLAKTPIDRRPADGMVLRRQTKTLDLEPLVRIPNRVDVIFDAANPSTHLLVA